MTVGLLQKTPGKRRQRTVGGGGVQTGLRLPGTSGNYISSPDSVLNSITGDIDIRVFLKAASYISGTNQAVIGKRDYGNTNPAYRIIIAGDGTFSLATWHGGVVDSTNSTTLLSSVVANGVATWIRATKKMDNSAGGSDTKYYYSSDGITWTQLGTTITTSGVKQIDDTNAPLFIGGTTGADFNGTIYYAEVRDGIDGRIVAKFDASTIQASGAQTPASVDGWTIVGSSPVRIDDYIKLPGTAGNYLSYPDTVANSVTGDIDIIAKVAADDWTPASTQVILSKNSSNQLSYQIYIDTSGKLNFNVSGNGTSSNLVNNASTSALGFTDGSTWWIRCTFASATGAYVMYTSPDGTTWTSITSATGTAGAIFDSTSVLYIGSNLGGTLNMFSGKIYYAAVKNGINGPVVASFDARDITTPWTMNGSGWSYEASSFTAKPQVALSLPGTTGNYASTPDSAVISVLGDLDVRVKAAATDWSPAVDSTLIGQYDTTGNQRAWRIHLNAGAAGAITFTRSTDGTLTGAVIPGMNQSFADGSVQWIRATHKVNNGAGGNDVTIYTSPDGIAWTVILGPVTTAGVFSPFNSTAPLEIGSRNVGAADWFGGKVYYAEVRNGIDGPIVARFDATAICKTGTRLPASTTQQPGYPAANLLTPNQASIETDASGWTNSGGNSTIAQSGAQFLDGTKSLAVTSTAGGSTSAFTTPIANGQAVVPGKAYAGKASFRAATTGRTVRVVLNWYTAASGFISNSVGSNVTDTTSGWTEATIIAIAPVTAAWCQLQVNISDAATGIAEVHYADRIDLEETITPWTLNGSAWDWVAV